MPTPFDVLDKLVQAGGPLGRDGVFEATEPKKAGDSLLKQLKADGLIGIKAGTHSITPAGLEAWKSQASPEKLAAFAEKERRQQRIALIEFLKAVEKKAGASFTEKQLKVYAQSTLDQAVKDGLAEEVKARTYKPLTAGEMLLLGEQPIEKQIKRLKEQHQEFGKGWHAASKKLLEDLSSLGGQELEALRSAAVKLDEEQRAAFADLGTVLRHLETFGGLAEAAATFQQKLEAMTAEAERAMAAERRLIAEQARIEQTAGEQAHRIESAHHRISERLDDLEKRQPIAAPPVVVLQGPTDIELWETTKAAYQRLHDETFRFGGIVKVPDLTDLVKKTYPGLEARAFHEALQEWQRQDKLTLQLCNDPHLEPRHAEGIHSPRGLLFYIQTR